jgi:hypothetical protein
MRWLVDPAYVELHGVPPRFERRRDQGPGTRHEGDVPYGLTARPASGRPHPYRLLGNVPLLPHSAEL